LTYGPTPVRRTRDLATLKLVRIIIVMWATFTPILMFLGRFVLDLSANTTTVSFDLEGNGACQ